MSTDIKFLEKILPHIQGKYYFVSQNIVFTLTSVVKEASVVTHHQYDDHGAGEHAR